MHGFVIEERGCPRCLILRTARFGGTKFCFNCRWSSAPQTDSGIAATNPHVNHAFTAPELARMRSYRAAVRYGLYTDEP